MMSNRSGTQLWKCRVCGEVYATGAHVLDVVYIMIRLFTEESFYEPGGVVSTHAIHHCKDGKTLGVTDYIGFELDREDTNDV